MEEFIILDSILMQGCLILFTCCLNEKIINSVLENIKPRIEARLIEMFVNKSDDDLFAFFSESFGDLMYDMFINKLKE
jgi:hypothetical protein